MPWSLAGRLDPEDQVNKRTGFMFNRVTHSAFVGCVALMLVACVFPKGSEGPIHTYRLSPEDTTWDPSALGSENTRLGVLLVNLPQAEAGFDTQRMAYVSRPHEVSFYAENQWAETPARMMAPLLSHALEKSGVWRAVIPVPTSVRGDYRLDSHGLALQQEFLQHPSRVRLTMRMQLVELREHRVIGARSIEVTENAPSEDAYGGVLAANRAVSRLLDQVVAWVGACLNKNQECPP